MLSSPTPAVILLALLALLAAGCPDAAAASHPFRGAERSRVEAR